MLITSLAGTISMGKFGAGVSRQIPSHHVRLANKQNTHAKFARSQHRSLRPSGRGAWFSAMASTAM